YVDKFEKNGILVYFEGDEHIRSIVAEVRPDIKLRPYNTPDFEVKEGVTYIKTASGEVALSIFGEHNLQNLMAAKLMVNEIDVEDEEFFEAISSFTGAAKRLEKVAENDSSVAYKDFAHSPSKLKATVAAVKH